MAFSKSIVRGFDEHPGLGAFSFPFEDGFVPPSLLSIFAFPQTFFHNGSAASLEDVMENVIHRTAGTNGVDVLSDEEDRRRLVAFLLSIDARTKPIDQTPE